MQLKVVFLLRYMSCSAEENGICPSSRTAQRKHGWSSRTVQISSGDKVVTNENAWRVVVFLEHHSSDTDANHAVTRNAPEPNLGR
jgi:hypothetical protein